MGARAEQRLCSSAPLSCADPLPPHPAQACGSARSVAAIKAGFHATAKGERKKAREALK